MIRMLTAREIATAAGAEAGFGALETEKGCLPLVSLDLDARIDGLVASSGVSQVFQNVFPDPLEATYVFPLPPRAAVVGFRMTVAGKVIEGRIDERAQARADYDEAIAEGRSAAIAEEERPDVFTLRVGNIPPGATARIEFTLVEPLSIDSLEATYRFPLVVAKRYCPGEPLDGDPVGDGVHPDTSLVPDASRLSPPVLLPGFPSPVRLGIRVWIRNAGNMVATSLPVTMESEADGLLLVVEPGRKLDRDFVLRMPIEVGSLPQAEITIESDAVRPVGMGRPEGSGEAAGDGTFSMVLLPPQRSPGVRAPRDVVFVLDRSGSMEGWQIAAARRAIGRMIDTLSTDDRVALIAFDDSLESPHDTPTLQPATDRTRWQLLEWLGGIDARGGTEMEQALAAGLGVLNRRRGKKRPAKAGAANPRAEGACAEEASVRAPILVLVTDGQIGDEDRVLARLGKSLRGTTLHVVGIDTSANAGLLARLADSSGGTHEIVESEERLDAVMDRIQERLVAPILTDIQVEGAGMEIVADSLAPSRRPGLYPGVPLILRGRCRGSGTVTVSGREADGHRWRIDVAPRAARAPGTGVLWARARLRQLEDELALAHGAADALERRIVDLSTGFGVLCRLTALVAIDPDAPEKAPSGEPRRVIQPVEGVWHAFQFLDRTSMCHSANQIASHFPDVFMIDEWPDVHTPFMRPLRPWSTATIPDLLAMIAPASRRPEDMPQRTVKWLMKAVEGILDEARSDGADAAAIELLTQALDLLRGDPASPVALRGLLDALAAAVAPADSAARLDRWWAPPASSPTRAV